MVRQAARGDDPDPYARTGATRVAVRREGEQAQLLVVSAATIDRMVGDVKVAAAGGRRRPAIRWLIDVAFSAANVGVLLAHPSSGRRLLA